MEKWRIRGGGRLEGVEEKRRGGVGGWRSEGVEVEKWRVEEWRSGGGGEIEGVEK